MFEILPIDISFVDEFSSPGRPGGDNSLYLAHGYLRSNSTPHDQIQVKFPAEGFSLYAANRRFEDYFIKEPGNLKHIISTEEQVKLEFHHPCGIAVMLDHLAQVPEKWMKIIEDVPILKNSSVVTFMPPGQYFVESGEILSHAIGHETNTYM
ncbi:MAG: hypothetical protein ACJ0KD_07310, partial [Dehalococcoidia bacterium]